MSYIEELSAMIKEAAKKPPPKPPSRLLKWFHRHPKWLWNRFERRDAEMPKSIIENPDGSWDILDQPAEETHEETPNLPVPVEPIKARPVPTKQEVKPLRWSWPILIVAFGLYSVAVGINVWNALGSSAVLLPAAMGILAESGLFFLTPVAVRGPYRVLAFAVCLFFFAFALLNGMRMASIVSADTAQARADRQTEGTITARADLDHARAERDKACTAGQAKSAACQGRKDDVAKLEKAATQARAEVAKTAKPESVDFRQPLGVGVPLGS